MYFYMPTKVYSERDCVKKYAHQWTALGQKALIVTGKSSEQNGARKDVTDALRENGTDFVIFDETEGDRSSGKCRFRDRDRRRFSDGCRKSGRTDDRAGG